MFVRPYSVYIQIIWFMNRPNKMKMVRRKCNEDMLDTLYVPRNEYRNSIKKKKVKSKMKLRTKRRKLISISENDSTMQNWNNCLVVLTDVMHKPPQKATTSKTKTSLLKVKKKVKKSNTLPQTSSHKPAFQVYEKEKPTDEVSVIIEPNTNSDNNKLMNFGAPAIDESDYSFTEFETSEYESAEDLSVTGTKHSRFSFVTSNTLTVLKENEMEQKQQSSNIIVHKISDDESILQIKDVYQEIKLYGVAQIELLCGNASIHGHTMKPYQAVDVYSLQMHSLMLMKLETSCSENSKHCALENIQARYQLENMPALENGNCAIFLIKRLMMPTMPGYSDVYKVAETDSIKVTKQVLDSFAIVETERCLKEYECFKTFRNRMLDEIETNEKFPIILTVGGRNTGKSSFNRYIINALLSSSSNCINFLECDVGQSEFTVSCLVSLNEVRQPLLGPPFTHNKTPLFSAYFGELSPADYPDEYIDCIQEVLKHHDASKCPLVVNTMGWNQNIGIQLLTDIIKIVKPDEIVQMETEFSKKNLPFISSEFVNYNPGWKILDGYHHDHKLNVMHVSLNGPTPGTGSAAHVHRDLMSLSYLQKFVENENTQINNIIGNASLVTLLCHMQPYKISVADIDVRYRGRALSPHEAISILNCSLVGLCVKNISSENDVMRCVGVGLVRGVEPDKHHLYILSLLPPSEMQKVDCLQHGNLRVPKNLLLQQKNVSNTMNLPYCSMDFNTSVSGSSKFKVYRKFTPISRKSN